MSKSEAGRSRVLVTLIGDIVGSREFESYERRASLQRDLVECLERANLELEPEQRLEPTVGDEFQGAFADVSAAVRAALVVRLCLLRHAAADARVGIGVGEVSVLNAGRSPVSQDGPGWWGARAAIERAEALGKASRTAFVRTCFQDRRASERDRGATGPALEAMLICQDQIVDRMSPRARRLLLELVLGSTQVAMAEGEQITQSAVSQSLARSGAFAIDAALARIDALGAA